jgi:hypothetical protein
MSSSNFTQALGLTINYWDEIGIWSRNKPILKIFLTLCSPPPSISIQKRLLNSIIKHYHTDLILSLDDLNSLLSIIENTSYVKTTTVDYDEGVDYPISFGINKIINTKCHLGHEFLTRFISRFIATTYSNLKLISYEEDDRKIYNAILATRELAYTNIVNAMKSENKLPDNTKTTLNKDIQRYREYIDTTTYSIENSFWRVFDYLPAKQNGSITKKIQEEENEKNKKPNVKTTSPPKKKRNKKLSLSENYVPRVITTKKKSWNTAKKEIESHFDYASLSLQSVLSFIIFVDQKKPELSNLLVFCFLTGLTLKKAISAIYTSTHTETLNVFISNTPTDSDLCSEIKLKISPKSLLHLDEKQLTIDELIDKIAGKFAYLTRQFSEFNGGNTLHFDRIASNSNRLLTPHSDDIRVHYLRGRIGFSMSAPFSYISMTNEEVGMLYQQRFDNLSKYLEDTCPKSLKELKWDSTLNLQFLGSQRLPTAPVANFFKSIRNKCHKTHEKFALLKNDQIRIDLINLQEIYVYFLEQILFSNRPNGEKSISILSDVLIRKDKNSINYVEYKTLPIPELYIKQKQVLNQSRIALHRHFDCHYGSNEATSCMLHFLKNGDYHPIYSALNRQILDVLNSFDIEVLSNSNNTLRHLSGNTLRHDPITSRALLGHNEDGFYYSSPASSSNIASNHQDILEYQNSLIKEFYLKVLHYDFN